MKYFPSAQVTEFLNATVLGKEEPYRQIALEGPAGCGKTALAEYIHGQLGYEPGDYLRFVCSRDTAMRDLFLDFTAKDGSTIEHEQAFLSLIQKPSVILLDEYKLSPPDVMAGLNSLLDQDKSWTSPDGRTFKRHPKCVIIFSTNPETYAGVKRQHGGLVDRLPMIKMDYAENEVEILQDRFPKLGDEMTARLVKFAQLTRQANKHKGLPVNVSTRALLTMAQMIGNGCETAAAAEFALSFTEEHRDVIDQHCKLALSAELRKDAATGKYEVDIISGAEKRAKDAEAKAKAAEERMKEAEKRVSNYAETLRKALAKHVK